MAEKPFRVLPKVTSLDEHFWKGGADGRLHLLRCRDCRQYVHPPQPVCPECLGKDLVPEAEVVSTLVPLFAYFKQQRNERETFGDFCARKGKEDLLGWAEEYRAAG